MNCVHAQQRLLAAREDSLPQSEAAELDAHLQGCPACRRLRADLNGGFAEWRARTSAAALPDVREAWSDLRTAREAEHAPRPAATWVRFGLPLAAAAAFAILFLQAPWRAASPTFAEGGGLAQVNYVVPGSPGSSTLVYEDRESGWLVVWTAEADPL